MCHFYLNLDFSLEFKINLTPNIEVSWKYPTVYLFNPTSFNINDLSDGPNGINLGGRMHWLCNTMWVWVLAVSTHHKVTVLWYSEHGWRSDFWEDTETDRIRQ